MIRFLIFILEFDKAKKRLTSKGEILGLFLDSALDVDAFLSESYCV